MLKAELPLGIVIKGESGHLGTIGVGAGHNDRAKMVAREVTQSAQTLSCLPGLALVPRGAVCRQLLYEAGLMDLARRRARELCRRAKSEPRRHLVACQPLPAEGDDRRGIGRRPG